MKLTPFFSAVRIKHMLPRDTFPLLRPRYRWDRTRRARVYARMMKAGKASMHTAIKALSIRHQDSRWPGKRQRRRLHKIVYEEFELYRKD